jgi:hypothetical protein
MSLDGGGENLTSIGVVLVYEFGRKVPYDKTVPSDTIKLKLTQVGNS